MAKPKSKSKPTKQPQKKTINLALQGGGSHGAYTWGVLDYLLEDDRLDFEGVSATSAGAMNAAALAYGKAKGGAQMGRETLEEFWREISRSGQVFSPVKRSAFEVSSEMHPFMPNWNMANSAMFSFFENFTHALSPYQFNPLNLNPLRDVIERTIDFDHVNACDCMQLFITATNVQKGTARVFENEDIDIDVLLASAALPFLFHAVSIKDHHYWDGGYMGNPSLWPLFYKAKSRDILMIHLNPITRDEVPRESYTIENRMNEITFNSSLLKELRAIDFVKKLINEDMLKDEYKDQYKDILFHAIRADDVMCNLTIASKFDTDWGFLRELRDLGRDQAKTWLDDHYDDIGEKGSVDIQKDYLSE
ncbi:MAG: patatin-like phospholipase family protein [Alphaproteobacteria bacterium]|nr:patatin-like phospholipase family protein [Alphaproteobacteria bacterium]